MNRNLRTLGKKLLLHAHEIGLKLNLIVLPNHYYVPIADLHELRRTRPQWARRSGMVGVDVDLDAQAQRLRELVEPFQSEYQGNKAYNEAKAGVFGPGFGYIEAQALHGMVRALKPRHIVEVGSGVSTYCMLGALEKNAAEGSPGKIVCIEPNPSEWLRQAPVTFFQNRLQDVDPNVLVEADFLFVDSSHTVKIGGDVNLMILEILPRLAPGTTVHFHDIYLPYDYQRDADRTLFQWMETAMLHAFLVGNRDFEILFCMSQLHYDRQDVLREVFPEYVPASDTNGLMDLAPGGKDEVFDLERPAHFPSSIYLRVLDRPA